MPSCKKEMSAKREVSHAWATCQCAGALISAPLAPFEEERFVVQGPEAALDGNNALHLTMALHELATNAVKYGALSNDDGKVDISGRLTTAVFSSVGKKRVVPQS